MSDQCTLTVQIDGGGAIDVTVLPDAADIDLTVQPGVYRGEPGKSPQIGASGCWEVWSDEAQDWVDSGVPAGGSAESDMIDDTEIDQLFKTEE